MSKRKKIIIIAGIFFGLITIVIIVNVLMLSLLGNGASRYSGAEREAAEKSINMTYEYIDNKARWAYRVYVEDVYPTTYEEKTQNCVGEHSRIIEDKNNPRYYTVVMSITKLFNFTSSEKYYRYGCSGVPESTF